MLALNPVLAVIHNGPVNLAKANPFVYWATSFISHYIDIDTQLIGLINESFDQSVPDSLTLVFRVDGEIPKPYGSRVNQLTASSPLSECPRP